MRMQGPTCALATALTSLEQAIARRSQHLALQRQQFEARSADVQTLNARQAQCVYLDVGGTHFHAGRDALQRHGPHYLSALTSGMFADGSEEMEHFFVDRDPRWFAVVLAYFRDGTVYRPSGRGALRGLQREVAFYAVPDLRRQVQSQKCLLAVTTMGCRPHVYEPDVGGWRQLRAPRHADVDYHMDTCVPWGRSLVVATFGPDGHPSLKLLDVDMWAWRTVTLPGITFEIWDMIVVSDGRLVLLFERSPGAFELQALDPAGVWHSVPLPAFFLLDEDSTLVSVSGLLAALYRPTSGGQLGFAVYDHGCWKRLPGPPNTLDEQCPTELEDRIVVMPMMSPGSRTLKQYVFSKACWEMLPEMQHLRADAVVVLWRHMLVVLGGHQSGPDYTAEAYDPAAGQWVTWPGLPFEPVHGHVYEEELLVCGRAGNVVRYESRSHCWRQIWHFDQEVLIHMLTLPWTVTAV